MEWIKQNPGQFIVCFSMVFAFIVLVVNSKKSKQQYIDRVSSRNEMSLCATCGNEYHNNNYYIVREAKHCPTCFERMFYQAKVGGGFIAVLMISSIVILISMTMAESVNGSFNGDYFWLVQKTWYLLFFGFIIYRLWRGYLELNKANEEHGRRSALDLKNLLIKH